MSEAELRRLNELVETAIYATDEGHPRGVEALLDLEVDLLTELGWIAPLHRGSASYRRGIEALEALRGAIKAERVLEPGADDSLS